MVIDSNGVENPEYNKFGVPIVRTSIGTGGISCYQDHIDLYMTNEVAINWNSALFWFSAYLD